MATDAKILMDIKITDNNNLKSQFSSYTYQIPKKIPPKKETE